MHGPAIADPMPRMRPLVWACLHRYPLLIADELEGITELLETVAVIPYDPSSVGDWSERSGSVVHPLLRQWKGQGKGMLPPEHLMDQKYLEACTHPKCVFSVCLLLFTCRIGSRCLPSSS